MSKDGFKVVRVHEGRLYSVGPHPQEIEYINQFSAEYFFGRTTTQQGQGPLLAMTDRLSCIHFYYDLQIANIHHKLNRRYMPCVVRYEPSDEECLWWMEGIVRWEMPLRIVKSCFPSSVLCREIELVEEIMLSPASEGQIVEAARRYFGRESEWIIHKL